MPWNRATAALGLVAALAVQTAWAQGPVAQQPAVQAGTAPVAPPPLRLARIGVFTMLGENVRLTVPDAPVTTDRAGAGAEGDSAGVPRNNSEPLLLKDIGLDQVALRSARQTLLARQPQASIHLYRATGPLTVQDQRGIVDGALRSELPGWIVELIDKQQLSQVLLVTLSRGHASFALAGGGSIGQGMVEGVGFYLDSSNEYTHPTTGQRVRGYIAPYAQMQLTLMDVASGQVLRQIDISDGSVTPADGPEQRAQPWNILSPAAKVRALRDLVERNVASAVPLLLAP